MFAGFIMPVAARERNEAATAAHPVIFTREG